MARDFHDEAFDRETELKLDIFRGYIREWLPVFLTGGGCRRVNILDFFAGPGRDTQGKKGSPLIIVEEVQRYLTDASRPKADGVAVHLYFNEFSGRKCDSLREEIARECGNSEFSVEVENRDFPAAFEGHLPALRASRAANLVILDQCGIKQVSPEVFRALVNCAKTDIIFFVSSSIVRRFRGEECVRRYFPGLSDEAIAVVDQASIHRCVCDYYRQLVPNTKSYFLAPFSIRKDANIYGLIFGTGNLLGLEKFLTVCWDKDRITGEANFNIDGDRFREEPSLFPEENVIRKQDRFREDLIRRIHLGEQTNNDLYRFTLECGFLPRHAREILGELQDRGLLTVAATDTSARRMRKGAFYLGWDSYKTGQPKAVFEARIDPCDKPRLSGQKQPGTL
ncbi:MAG: three-Cys-motif partner protein TcmP [Phycisphaerae bacterium]|nr:three-Cys-motif partner protein TcmP [Phycisphaerae bacterium]